MSAYDFARRRRRVRARRRGRVPPQLRAWVFRRRGRRARAAPLYEPRRRRRRLFTRRRYDPGRRFRRRRYDIPGIRSPLVGSLLQPIFTTIGGWLHNWLVNRQRILAGSINIGGMGNLTHAGGLLGILGAILDYTMPNKTYGAIANAIGSGAMCEGFNIPAIEGVATPQAISKVVSEETVPADAYMPVAM